MSHQLQFDPDQWRVLQFAPFLILSGIAGRYRNFRVEEMQVFERWLDEASRAPGSLNREVLTSVSANLVELAAEFESYERTIAGGLVAVGDTLAGQPSVEVALFRDALIKVLGAGIARSRGPYGKEPTLEGEQMLMMLEEFLRPEVVFPAASGDAA